jgi:hypothetical protein
MFDVLILICAASLTHAECQKTTARLDSERLD